MARWLLPLSLVTACSGGPYEGDDPGECTDGADNDLDGFFDCNDNDCQLSPDCAGAGAIPGGGGGTDDDGTPTDDVEEPGNAAAFTSATITYDLAIDLQGLAESLCEAFDICDCVNHYEGTATQVEAVGTRVTMEGTFELVETNCNTDAPPGQPTLSDVIWVPTDGQSFHTFRFDTEVTEATEWIAHGGRDDTERITVEPKRNKQYWIAFEDGAPLSGTTVTYDYVERNSDPLAPIETTHTLEIVFGTD